MGIQPTQINTTEKWNRAYKPILVHANLGTDSVSAGSVYEDYGAVVITIPNPHQPVNVAAWGQAWVLNATDAGANDNVMRLAISIDGGISYNFGPPQIITLNATVALFRQSFAPHYLVSGLPTGDIKVKAQIQHIGGVPVNSSWLDGNILVQVTPLP